MPEQGCGLRCVGCADELRGALSATDQHPFGQRIHGFSRSGAASARTRASHADSRATSAGCKVGRWASRVAAGESADVAARIPPSYTHMWMDAATASAAVASSGILTSNTRPRRPLVTASPTATPTVRPVPAKKSARRANFAVELIAVENCVCAPPPWAVTHGSEVTSVSIPAAAATRTKRAMRSDLHSALSVSLFAALRPNRCSPKPARRCVQMMMATMSEA
mmetsp:Transcript_29015/g.46530  ORF Transcript_29015/g.46530 Transcript_29015/m.46530 type:complete len:223 (-) Transcript_29015:1137-1805(-)